MFRVDVDWFVTLHFFEPIGERTVAAVAGRVSGVGVEIKPILPPVKDRVLVFEVVFPDQSALAP